MNSCVPPVTIAPTITPTMPKTAVRITMARSLALRRKQPGREESATADGVGPLGVARARHYRNEVAPVLLLFAECGDDVRTDRHHALARGAFRREPVLSSDAHQGFADVERMTLEIHAGPRQLYLAHATGRA
jgi:hypothetical protein